MIRVFGVVGARGAKLYRRTPFFAKLTIATHNYQTPALSYGTQYWWRASGIDPGGSNTVGPVSAIQSFTTQIVPAAPTLTSPSGTNVLGLPVFTLRTIDQTASQSGWTGQDNQSGTDYTGNSVITNSKLATHLFIAPALTPSQTYWWRAYAIDPGGSNTFSPASAISSFTVGPTEIRIGGGIKILGGTRIGN